MTDPSYRIQGSDLQFVEMTLAPGETAVGEPGAMMFMDESLAMDTVLGDGRDVGLITRISGALKRLFTGESMFSTVFTNRTGSTQRVAFAAQYPGQIIAINLADHGGTLICQKGAYLCSTQGVQVGIAFKKRLRVGFFGGEGFILQKITGEGTAFIHATGALTETLLGPNDALKIDTGCIAAMQSSTTYDIRYVGKLKSALFGGEGLFFAHVRGPGRVWLQSLPMERLARGLFSQATLGKGKGLGFRSLYLLIVALVVLASIFGENG